MATFDTWESYFYPPPDDAVMRNKFDLRDPQLLARAEYTIAGLRQTELLTGQRSVERTYDADHVRAIHRELFGDLYEWAGEYRSVNMWKGSGGAFANADNGEIDGYLDDVKQLVEAVDWPTVDQAEFGASAGVVFAYLNQAHPFREGNGRTSKVFMEHVAEQSHFTLDFASVPPVVWNHASQMSRPAPREWDPDPRPLMLVFQAIATPRTSSSPAPAPTPPPSVLASYPQSARAAAQQPYNAPGRPAGPQAPGQTPGLGR